MEIKEQRAVQDKAMAAQHRDFDLAAQDNTPKYHRSHFAVVGEGTRSARENYEAGYAAIDWRN